MDTLDIDALDIVHGVLDVLGFIPRYGAIADVLNAVVYAVEGDWKNVAISVVATIPGIGDVVASLKVSSKSVKFFGMLAKSEKMCSFFSMMKGLAMIYALIVSGKMIELRILNLIAQPIEGP